MTDTTTKDNSYVLADLENEIERLGFQHQVWSDGTRELWQKAGVAAGAKVLDAGCGPGYASIDLSKIVTADGHVTALDLTTQYLEHLHKQISENSITNITVVESKLSEMPLPDASFDFVFVRFVLLFNPDLAPIMREFHRVLKPNGKVMVVDYLHAGKYSPPVPELDEFMEFLETHFAKQNVNLKVGRSLPKFLVNAGFEISALTPIIKIGRPNSDVWEWAGRFVSTAVPSLVKQGALSQEKGNNYLEELQKLAQNPAAFLTTSLFLHIIATKKG